MGTSLSVMVSLELSPDVSLELKIQMLTESDSIYISNTHFEFTSGEVQKFFVIQFKNGIQGNPEGSNQVKLSFSLDGINKNIYVLERNSMQIPILEQDNLPPEFVQIIVSGVQQHSSELIVQSSEITDLYYMVALEGTEQPSQDMLLNEGPLKYLES